MSDRPTYERVTRGAGSQPGATRPKASCTKCGGTLTACTTCGKPAQCGEAWCAACTPDGSWTGSAPNPSAVDRG